jgi:glycerol-3-phosphate O-acyltransferase
VDVDGVSYGNGNQVVDVKAYFKSFGELNEDFQREAIYTKALAEKILERYSADNLVLSSHLVAFAAFRLLMHENASIDLYGLLRLPTKNYYFSIEKLLLILTHLQKYLLELEQDKKIRLSKIICGEVKVVLEDGVKKLGSYHVNKPLQLQKGKVFSRSFPLLYYYHNRLSQYELEKAVHWDEIDAVSAY